MSQVVRIEGAGN